MPYSKPNKNIFCIDLGQIDYQPALQAQEQLFLAVIDQKNYNRDHDTDIATDNHLVLCEHNPIFTLGKSGKEAHLLASEQELAGQGFEFARTSRGGDITYHGPGQLTGYPILDLDNFFTDIHRYLRGLEEVIILVLAEFGIVGVRIDGLTGVWVADNKICAFGVKTSRWVTMHGFGFNVCPDLSHFKHIVPCGIVGRQATSLSKEAGRHISISEVKPLIIKYFSLVFEADIKQIK